jgi:hypothetical protein
MLGRAWWHYAFFPLGEPSSMSNSESTMEHVSLKVQLIASNAQHLDPIPVTGQATAMYTATFPVSPSTLVAFSQIQSWLSKVYISRHDRNKRPTAWIQILHVRVMHQCTLSPGSGP